MQNKMTVAEAIEIAKEELQIMLTAKEKGLVGVNENNNLIEALQTLISHSQKQECGELKADEVTLQFFRKYLEMPNGNLEEMCKEIIRLKQKRECVGVDIILDQIIQNFIGMETPKEIKEELVSRLKNSAQAIVSLQLQKKPVVSKEDIRRVVERNTYHRSCEDTYYSCPLSTVDREPEPDEKCDCMREERINQLTEEVWDKFFR